MSEELENRSRKFIFDYFFKNSRAPVVEEMMESFHLDRVETYRLLKRLEELHHIILVPGTQRILMANPFSAIATPFVDRIQGQSYFANCAWDTVSMHVMVEKDAEVESFCHHCGGPIRISLSNGKNVKSKPENPLIFLSVPVAHWYDNLINTCSNNMVYFASKDHQKEWLDSNPNLHGETLTIDKMAEACQPLSKNRMSLNYVRPTSDKLVAYWNTIGLRGEYWKI